MKPTFESPAHTARDLVERDITLYMQPDMELWKQILSQSDILEYKTVAESMIITETDDQFESMIRNELLSQGTHVWMGSYMFPSDLDRATEFDHDWGKYKYNHGRGYYKGERVDLAGVPPEGGYLSHKEWHLNEVEWNLFL